MYKTKFLFDGLAKNYHPSGHFWIDIGDIRAPLQNFLEC